MVAGSDSKTSPKVVDDGPGGGLPLQRRPEGGDAASERDTDDEDDLASLLACGVDSEDVNKLTLSQLTCLYQFDRVMGKSVMCGFLGSYLGLRFGSVVLAMEEGCLT